jgi:hypothetical protein
MRARKGVGVASNNALGNHKRTTKLACLSNAYCKSEHSHTFDCQKFSSAVAASTYAQREFPGQWHKKNKIADKNQRYKSVARKNALLDTIFRK